VEQRAVQARHDQGQHLGHGLSAAGGAVLVAQFILLFIVGRDWVPALRWLGYAIWVAAAVLGWLPIVILKRQGGVAPGKSYVRTSRLVTTGLYAVVRHPQYLAFYLMTFGLALIGQHWLIVLLAVPAVLLFWLSMRGTDRFNIAKFGDDYRQYRDRVPAFNILAGTIRLLARRRSRS
jgi:protein-S-isoprenylcysteine O-methyltransferase Ste14